MNYIKDLDLALKLCTYNRTENYYNKIFTFTTENLLGYMSNQDFNNKKILTVGSSIDQAFNSFLLGAKEITLFDINPFTKYFYELKSAAIKTLTLEEFFNFFFYLNYPTLMKKNKLYLNKKDLNKINNYLSEDSYYFWNTIRDNFTNREISNRLFTNDIEKYNVIKKVNLYLDESKYQYLKNNIDNINITFIKSDLSNITKYLTKTYDIVMLSNISSACLQKQYKNDLKSFKIDIDKLNNYLNINGSIFIAYLYNYTEFDKYKRNFDKIHNIEYVKELFDGKIYSKTFTGIEGISKNDNSIKDTVLIYKR